MLHRKWWREAGGGELIESAAGRSRGVEKRRVGGEAGKYRDHAFRKYKCGYRRAGWWWNDYRLCEKGFRVKLDGRGFCRGKLYPENLDGGFTGPSI